MHTVDEHAISEYDLFGPWVDEVGSPAEVPPLFRAHPLDLAAARLVLKVPRNIARRDAHPGMDLYDHLLVVEADQLTVLSRTDVPGQFSVLTRPLEQVVAVLDDVSLLDGRLTVYLRDGGKVQVRYNGSARTAISRFVAELRSAATAAVLTATATALLTEGRRCAADLGPLDPGPADTALRADYADLRRAHTGVQAWTCHGRVPLTPGSSGVSGLVQNTLHALSPATLQGCVVAADDVALEVLGRREWLVRGRSTVESAARLTVAWSQLERLDITVHPRYPSAAVVALTSGACTTTLTFPVESRAHALFRDAAARA